MGKMERRFEGLSSWLCRLRCSRASAMVEAIPTTLTIFVVILVLFDLGRYLAIKGVLTYGAYQGLNLASKIPEIGFDERTCLDVGNPPICHEAEQQVSRDQYRAAVDRVLRLTKSFPASTLVVDQPTGPAHLVEAKFVRPGQADSPLGGQCAVAPPFEGYRALMKDCPISVELSAQVSLIVPFLRPLTVTGRAYGFREPALSGGLAPVDMPSTSGGPAPSPTPTPTGSTTCTSSPPPECLAPLNDFTDCVWDTSLCICSCLLGSRG